jgi:hypothetical protein
MGMRGELLYMAILLTQPITACSVVGAGRLSENHSGI